MAGFKNTILSHSPVLLLSFDGDTFDPNNRKLTAIPQTFLDESGWNSNILLHNEDEAYPAYRMGIPSLVDLEQTDQRACSFGWYGYQPSATTRWPKAFVEVQHQSHLALSNNLGSYSVGFFINKMSDESNWRTQESLLGNPYWLDLNKRIMRKAGSFDVYYRDNYSAQDELRFGFPGGEISWIVPAWFYAKKNFVVATWEVVMTDPDVYSLNAKLYVNGHLYKSYSSTSSGTFPNSTSTSPIEIAGVINASASFDDRQTSDMRLDQMFVVNKTLTQDEICRLYRKSKTYDNIAVQALATAYWPMTDVEDASVFTMLDMVGYNNGVYEGGVTKFLREQPAPKAVLGGSSVFFHDGGIAAAHRNPGGFYQPLFSFGGDFTVHFWASFENTNRSILWVAQGDDYPFKGVVLEANRRNGIDAPGHVQFSTSVDYQVSSKAFQDNGTSYNFNDGQMHHFAMVRKSGMIYLWIDGILHGSLTAPVQSISAPSPGSVFFMGQAPGNLHTRGYMSSVGVFGYAFDDAEIRMLNSYSLIYRIQGTVTLEGNPHHATVRAFRHRDGGLTKEVESDSNSGDYVITLYDNSLIDLMVLNKQDQNIRYRVYGPITPALYEDLP